MKKNIVAIFAHPDDEVLGCGGSLALHKSFGDSVHVLILSKGLKSRDNCKIPYNIFKKQIDKANRVLGVESVRILDFPDNSFDSVKFIEIVKSIESFIKLKKGNIIYTHHVGDLNIDHEITHKAVLTATRPNEKSSVEKILSCEVNSSTEWSFNSKEIFRLHILLILKRQLKLKKKHYKNIKMK